MSCEGFTFSEVRQGAQETSAVPTCAPANTMSANPGDANYATFLESVPTPKMAAEKTV